MIARATHAAALAGLGVVAMIAVALAPVRSAAAIEIQRVISPGGIEAWLVEQHVVPVIAVSVLFEGGSYHVPQDKAGLAYLLSATLDEGAGEIRSDAFQQRLRDRAIELSFDAGRDAFEGRMRTLSMHRDEAFDLFSMALTDPRFDDEPVERMKQQLLAQIERDAVRPGRQASQAWFRATFGDGGYGVPLRGNADSMSSIEPGDLEAFHSRLMVRDRLKIAVVGDIDAATLGPLLDQTFGKLPETGDLPVIADIATETGPRVIAIEKDVPQIALRFGLPGLTRDHPDFIAAFVMNHILGGGSFSSRLFTEVREKRGLTYSIFSSLFPLEGTGLFLGGAATRADRAAETLEVVRAEIGRMAESGPTVEELEVAKRFLTGAYALRFDSSTKIANQLIGIQQEDLGIDYVNQRNSLIQAVTIEDVRRVSAELLRPDQMLIVAVGPKEALKALGDGS